MHWMAVWGAVLSRLLLGSRAARARAGMRMTLQKKTQPTFQHTHTPHTKRKRHTRLCSKVNRPTEPCSILDRINTIICKQLQLANEPLPMPTTLILQPQLLLQDLCTLPGALARAHITCTNMCVDRTCHLREPRESIV